MRMRALLVWTLILSSSMVLQSSVFVHLELFGAQPDLILIAVVFLGMLRGKRDGGRMGFLFGLFEDLFIGRLIGINALTKSAIGFLIGQVEQEIVKENVVFAVSMVWVFTVVNHLLYGLIMVVLGNGLLLGLDYLRTLLTSAFYNAMLGAILFPLYYRLLLGGVLGGDRRR